MVTFTPLQLVTALAALQTAVILTPVHVGGAHLPVATSTAPGTIPPAYTRVRGPKGMLNILDFGAVGDGTVDCSAAIQRAIDQAQLEYRALLVPAGIYRVDRGLFVNKTVHSPVRYSPSTSHWSVAPLRLVGEGATNGEGQAVIFAAKPMAAVLTYASSQPMGTPQGGEVPGNLTENHSLEQITLDANFLANFSVYAPAVVGSKWQSVSFVHGMIAGLYLGYGWIHNIEGCAFKGNAVANLYLDRACNAVNVLNNNFAASLGVGIIANYGEAVRIEGNCFQSLGGPAIYANQMGALAIKSNYFEANNLRSSSFTWIDARRPRAPIGLCAEVVLNGAGNQSSWSTDPAGLGQLVVPTTNTSLCPGGTGPQCYTMAPQLLAADNWLGGAVYEANYHDPGFSKCGSSAYTGVYVGGGQGISVSSNDCRGCGKANKTRVCVAVQGNTSGVEQRLNTGEWAQVGEFPRSS
jgi:hypothetical protein